jgi:ornithine decarboxylase
VLSADHGKKSLVAFQVMDDLLADPELTTPFMVTDLPAVVRNLQDFRAAIPRCEVFYAIKANSHREVLRALHGAGSRFEVASFGELELARAAGIPAASCIFSNPVKIPAHVEQAADAGVEEFAFDSLDELDKIAKHAPGSSVYLRIAVPDSRSSFPLSRKFGADWTDAPHLAEHADMVGLRMEGITFHVGSQCVDAAAWREAIRTVASVIHSLTLQGTRIRHVNLGGGFPARYASPVPSLGQIGDVIAQAVDELLPPGIALRAEPGRALVAGASAIATTVIGRETRLGGEWLYLDMGAFQGLIECLENPNWAYPIEPLAPPHPSVEYNTFTVSGPTCDPADAVGHSVLLPDHVRTGDRLVIRSTGAYSLVYGSSFNGFETPQVITVPSCAS